jgi:hypothetical protein
LVASCPAEWQRQLAPSNCLPNQQPTAALNLQAGLPVQQHKPFHAHSIPEAAAVQLPAKTCEVTQHWFVIKELSAHGCPPARLWLLAPAAFRRCYK